MPKLSLLSLLSAAVLTICSPQVTAADQLLLEFKLLEGEKLINAGKGIVARSLRTWSFGTSRSYLRLRCHHPLAGKVQKIYSTEDHFHGLKVQYKSFGNELDISVTRNDVQPRLAEIRALAKNECRDLNPIVTTTTEQYRLPAKPSADQVFPFGDNMTFVARLSTI